jgi:hypothetical protein
VRFKLLQMRVLFSSLRPKTYDVRERHFKPPPTHHHPPPHHHHYQNRLQQT